MSISVNGQSRVPPGFRFHPTDEELLHYYLRKKVLDEKIDLDVIRYIDLNKLEPWDIQGSTPQNEWYFFSHKDKKYPTGRRTNRATAAGFWKATGRDKVIYSSSRQIGMRKTLVFYTGRAPHGQKSVWIMYEYRLEDSTSNTNAFNSLEERTYEDGWVVCRIFKKRNQQNTVKRANSSSITTDTDTETQKLHSGKDDGGLEDIFQYMGTTCKQENEKINTTINITTTNNMTFLNAIGKAIGNGLHERFMPPLESLTDNGTPFDQACEIQSCYGAIDVQMLMDTEGSITNPVYDTDWAGLDRLVASHLNCQAETVKELASFDNTNMGFSSLPEHVLLQRNGSSHTSQDYKNEMDLWSFTHSSPSGP
ncbi:hypothetical protein HHK36_009587 [Tetracentron sinense]|uniref:NAC domain-containing protein n=1 Tax=Tetracentron sinense TaxID=13715 RepID=A0A834ZBY9_TETSI|nr:hypothetical protein HHK36_009587 [Tetracentron sinense]